MKLFEFIEQKEVELSRKHSYVRFQSVESVAFSKNCVSSQFNSELTPLEQEGSEVDLSELGESRTVPFKANGTEVKFAVRFPRKRTDTILRFYFLWDKEDSK